MFTALRNAYARLTAVLERIADRFEEFEAQIGKPETTVIEDRRKVTTNGKRN